MTEEIKDQRTDEETFDDAFEEATKVVDPAEVVDQKLEAEPQTPVEPAPVVTTPDPEKDTEPVTPEVIDWKAEAEKAEQKMRSWEGRINAANKRAEDAERRLQEKESPTQAQEPSVLPGGEEDETVLNAFIKDYPTLEKPIVAMARKVAEKIVTDRMKELKPELDEVRATVKSVSTDNHFDTIRKAHKDFEEISSSGKLTTWLDTQPKYLRPVYDRIVKSGSTEEVIGMFDSFRRDNPVTPSPTPNRIEPATKKVDSLLAVPGSTGGPSLGKKKIDENDFDSAWSEAISAKKR